MGEGRTDRPSPDLDRLTVAQAAAALGISQDAVRKRIARGTIPHDRDESGRVYVYLSPSETVHKTDQDDTSKTVQDAYVRSLEDQITFLRRELERKDTILLNLTERIPQLGAPGGAEASESPETVEEATERAAPRSTTGEVQESTGHPQQRGGWLAPVDKLPWWSYVLGTLLVLLSAYLVPTALKTFGVLYDMALFPGLSIVLGALWLPPGVFGFSVGFLQRSARLRSEVLRFGVVVGIALMLGAFGFLVQLMQQSFTNPPPRILVWVWLSFAIATFLPGWLFYVSGALIGNAWQRRRTGRISGTIPASPMLGGTRASPNTLTDWTPRLQAIVGFAGTVIAALISLIGTIISVMSSGSGGGGP